VKKNNGFTLVEKKRKRKDFENKNEKKQDAMDRIWQFCKGAQETHNIKKQIETKKQKNKLGLEPEYEKALSLNNKHYQNVDLSKIQWKEIFDLPDETGINDPNFHAAKEEREREKWITSSIVSKIQDISVDDFLPTDLHIRAERRFQTENQSPFTADNIFEPLKRIFMHLEWQEGFSLLELMVVMAIIGILGTLCIPTYRDYIVRAKVSELLTLAQPTRLAVTESLMSGGTSAQLDNAKLGIPKLENKGKIKELSVAAGVISITANSKEIGLEENKAFKIILTPIYEDMLINWKCSVEPADLKKYAPENCRG
jgi:type IV pilus assembly protein PilA